MKNWNGKMGIWILIREGGKRRKITWVGKWPSILSVFTIDATPIHFKLDGMRKAGGETAPARRKKEKKKWRRRSYNERLVEVDVTRDCKIQWWWWRHSYHLSTLSFFSFSNVSPNPRLPNNNESNSDSKVYLAKRK